LELSDAVVKQLDVEGVVAFAEHLLTNAARLWIELGLDQKQRLQRVFSQSSSASTARNFEPL
jgi:uncharacterized protein YaeQ